MVNLLAGLWLTRCVVVVVVVVVVVIVHWHPPTSNSSSHVDLDTSNSWVLVTGAVGGTVASWLVS